MDRTERLLDLVALLLDAKEPITWAELREAFPEDYGKGSDEAAERKFERDKAELLELGLPIAYAQGEDDRRDGYEVDKSAYYLPQAGLTPEETAVLYAAGAAALSSGAFPGRQELTHALRKIAFFSAAAPPSPPVRLEPEVPNRPELAAWLEELWAASAAKKWVQLSYFSPHANQTTERRVDPYGLALRGGIWSLVGYCHLRQGVRTFHVPRIQRLKVNTSKPRSADFEVPAAFVLSDYVASHPWQHRFHEKVEVELHLGGELAPLAKEQFPGARVELGEGKARVFLQATFLEGLLRHVLALGPNCKVVAPEEAKAAFVRMAQAVLALHADGPRAVGG